jgi:hypothetical protein
MKWKRIRRYERNVLIGCKYRITCLVVITPVIAATTFHFWNKSTLFMNYQCELILTSMTTWWSSLKNYIRSAIQEICHFYGTRRFNIKSAITPYPKPAEPNPHFPSKIHINIIHLLRPRLPQIASSLKVFEYFIKFPHRPNACYMPQPYQLPWDLITLSQR